MRVQQVPNSPYFIRYDDNGFCSVSRDKDGKEPIPESEMQEFLGAVANGLLCIEQERKSRYQRIEEAKKAAFAKGEAEGREDELLSTVRALKEEQVSRSTIQTATGMPSGMLPAATQTSTAVITATFPTVLNRAREMLEKENNNG